MGGVPKGEDPLAGAKRELLEETGQNAASWTEMMRLHLSNSITDEVGIAYLATELTEGQTAHEETEDITVKTVSVAEAVAMARRGAITDALSVATLLRYALENGID
jgi:8-oxo-dGTP pyrophosphatase MutT (NUDIX family)